MLKNLIHLLILSTSIAICLPDDHHSGHNHGHHHRDRQPHAQQHLSQLNENYHHHHHHKSSHHGNLQDHESDSISEDDLKARKMDELFPKNHKSENQPKCEFSAPKVFPKSSEFFQDCDQFIDKKHLSIIDKVGNLYYEETISNMKHEQMDRREIGKLLSAKGVFELARGETLCIPDGAIKVTNEDGKIQTVASGTGLKIKLKETRHLFPVLHKECRGQGYQELTPEQERAGTFVAENGKTLAIQSYYQGLDETSHNCHLEARGFRYETTTFGFVKTVNMHCIAPTSQIELLSLHAKDNAEHYEEIQSLQISYLGPDGKVKELPELELKNDGGIALESTIKLGSAIQSLKLEPVIESGTFINPFQNVDLILHNGSLYTDPEGESNSVNAKRPDKRFHMKCVYDKEAAWQNMLGDGEEFHRGTVDDLPRISQYNLFEEIRFNDIDRVKGKDNGRFGEIEAINYKKDLNFRFKLEGLLEISRVYMEDDDVQGFQCSQRDDRIICELKESLVDDILDVGLNLYPYKGPCHKLGHGFSRIHAHDTVEIKYDSMHLPWNNGNEAHLSVCTIYGICTKLKMTRTASMVAHEKAMALLESNSKKYGVEDEYDDEDEDEDDDEWEEEFDDDEDDDDDYDDHDDQEEKLQYYGTSRQGHSEHRKQHHAKEASAKDFHTIPAVENQSDNHASRIILIIFLVILSFLLLIAGIYGFFRFRTKVEKKDDYQKISLLNAGRMESGMVDSSSTDDDNE